MSESTRFDRFIAGEEKEAIFGNVQLPQKKRTTSTASGVKTWVKKEIFGGIMVGFDDLDIVEISFI